MSAHSGSWKQAHPVEEMLDDVKNSTRVQPSNEIYPSPTLTPLTSCAPTPWVRSPARSNEGLIQLALCSEEKLRLGGDASIPNMWQNDLSQEASSDYPPFHQEASLKSLVTAPLRQSIYNRRKCTSPYPSIDASLSVTEKQDQKIFKLNVFDLLLERPHFLLYRHAKDSLKTNPSRSTDPSTYQTLDHPKTWINRKVVHGTESRSKSIKVSRTSSAPSTHAFQPTIMKQLPNYLKDPELVDSVDLTLFKETRAAPCVSWKGHPLAIDPNSDGYDQLTPEELRTCVTLRLMPHQYLHIKETLLKAAFKGPYKKRDAQGWFRIDVNKTNKVYDWFVMIGWIPESPTSWVDHMSRYKKNY